MAVPFGHCQFNAPLSRAETYFFHKMEEFNTLGRRSDCRAHSVFSVWAFCGSSPTKKAHNFFEDFGSISYVQKVENYYFQFWAKKMCRSMYFGLRSTVNWFFGPKINLKKFRFLDLEKFQFFFLKICQIFFDIYFKFFNFFHFFTNFYNFHQLLTHLELY